ncbi:MAG: DNA polymerase III subunit alpha [Nitrospirae bacterium]|nr:DNA polymerase III subunit alpha [Nitrospirota bacterium]MCL5978657.1 DNA polymerase III subunit alpha [Nitrospirota bacterium]
MQHSDFVPLHLHTEYSLLDGAIKIDELVEQASAYKMPAVAITDHGNLFGVIDFYKKAMKKGIKPIIGCEVYVAPNSRFDRSKTSIDNGLSDEAAAFHLILLARDSMGYKNLATLVTKAYLEGFYYKPRIDKDLLEQYSGGLIGLTACLKGEVPYYLRNGNKEKAREVALRYKHMLGPENFYFEIQHNGMPEQEEANKLLAELSRELHIPLVATNDCHYLKKEDARAHDILLCIQTGKTVKDEKRLKMSTDEFYFKSPDEMKHAFRDVPEAILNTRAIAERCNFDFALGKSLLPKYDLPDGVSPDSYLENLALDGLQTKFRGNPPANYLDRLKLELQVIKKMGYSSYFLIVWDFISYARKKGIPVGPGRGSAAGSLVAYCLDITEIDPLKYNLLFERFLNPERISMPDIDVDFCKDRRGEVINYVGEKYGSDHVTQIITFGTMAAKAAIRDVGRVMDIPYAEVDKIAKLVPGHNISIGDSLKVEPQLKELYDNNPAVKELLDIAQRLEGLSRHAGTHAAGVVIAPKPLTDFMPLYKNPSEDTVTTQFDMGSVESVGLLKFDFLGLKTLTVLEKTVDYIKQQGSEIVLSEIPIVDEKTYRLLSSGETTGIFQLESSGMRDILVRMHPNRFEDLIALVALYRPGPMAWIDDFIKRKKGETKVEYELPLLKEILDETYGIIIYQEQVMMIANKIAGFSMGQADILRRAMGKKKQEEMEEQKEVFVKGAVANGFPEIKAQRLFEIMEPFARYGFNKSHSAAYAYVAYQTAYLKAHYPVEFMTANLSVDMGDTDKIVKLINECRNMSISILPPDINESEREFKIVGSSVRFGLEAVKGVGTAAIEIILKERENKKFETFEDFMSRGDNKKVNKKVVESLIKAGAFDSIYSDNRFAARAKAMDKLVSSSKTNGFGPGLFGDSGIFDEAAKQWDENTLLNNEKEALGFYISGHPLTRYRKTLSSMDVVPLSYVEEKDERADLCVAGIISEMKSKAKEKGITAYLTMEDETGRCDILVFPDLYKKSADSLKRGNLVIIRGQVFKSEKGAKVMAREIQNLTEMEISTKYEVALRCGDFKETAEKLMTIKKLLGDAPNGKDSVSFKFYLPEYCVIIASRLQPVSNFAFEAEKITGETVKVL